MAPHRRPLLLLSAAALLAGCGPSLALTRKGDEELARGNHQAALANYSVARGIGPDAGDERWRLDSGIAQAHEHIVLDSLAGLRQRLDGGDARGALVEAVALERRTRGHKIGEARAALARFISDAVGACWAPIDKLAKSGDHDGAIAAAQQLAGQLPEDQHLAARVRQLQADAARFYTGLAERAREQGRPGSQVFLARMAARFGAPTTPQASEALTRVRAMQQPPRASLRVGGVACPGVSTTLAQQFPQAQDARPVADVLIEFTRCPLRVRRFAPGASETMVDTSRGSPPRPASPSAADRDRAADQSKVAVQDRGALAQAAPQSKGPTASKAPARDNRDKAAAPDALSAPDKATRLDKAARSARSGDAPKASALEMAGGPAMPLPDEGPAVAPLPERTTRPGARSPEGALLDVELQVDALATVSFRGLRRQIALRADRARTSFTMAHVDRDQADQAPEVRALQDEAARALGGRLQEHLNQLSTRRDAVLAAADARAAAGDADAAEDLYAIAMLWAPQAPSPGEGFLARRYGLLASTVASVMGAAGSAAAPQLEPFPTASAPPAAEADAEALAVDRLRWEPRRSDGSWELFGAYLQPRDPSRASSAMVGAGRSGQWLWRGIGRDSKHETDGLALAVFYQGKLGVESHRNIYGDVHAGVGIGLSRGPATVVAIGGGGADGLGGGDSGYFNLGSSMYGFYGARALFQLAWPWDLEATFARAHRYSRTQDDRVGEELRFDLRAVRFLSTTERSISLGLSLTDYEHGRSAGGSLRMVF